MKKLILALLFSIFLVGECLAQVTTPGLARKLRGAATLPATCQANDIYRDSDATSGQQIYLCESANTWVLQGDGGGTGGATAWDDIGDPDADATIAFAGYEETITSTLDEASHSTLTITNTDADAANDNYILSLKHNDGADANVFYLRMIGDADGTPTNDFLFSQSNFTSLLPIIPPAEAYDATNWDADTGAPQKDAIRDKLETMPQTAGDALTLTGTDMDFDGGATPGGELGGTWASPTIDDSVTVDSWALGNSTATTLNKLTLTQPANGSTLTMIDGKTLTVTNTLNLGATLTDEYVCNYEATGTQLNCDIAIDATTSCGAGTVCGGGHTHGASEITEADPLALLTAGTDNVKDTHIDWGSGASQVDLADIPGGTAPASEFDFNAATMEIPNSAADVALADAGNLHFNTTDEQLSFHSAADGEISGEASISLLRHISMSFDPSGWYDQESVNRTVPVMYVGDDAPEGITITEWKMFYVGGNPTTELDADLVCDTTPDFGVGAGATVMDVLDTTAGASTADTGFDSATCANGSYMYVHFGADPTDANVIVQFDLWFYNEED